MYGSGKGKGFGDSQFTGTLTLTGCYRESSEVSHGGGAGGSTVFGSSRSGESADYVQLYGAQQALGQHHTVHRSAEAKAVSDKLQQKDAPSRLSHQMGVGLSADGGPSSDMNVSGAGSSDLASCYGVFHYASENLKAKARTRERGVRATPSGGYDGKSVAGRVSDSVFVKHDRSNSSVRKASLPYSGASGVASKRSGSFGSSSKCARAQASWDSVVAASEARNQGRRQAANVQEGSVKGLFSASVAGQNMLNAAVVEVKREVKRSCVPEFEEVSASVSIGSILPAFPISSLHIDLSPGR